MNIFIFHRDFRIEDNRGLIALAKEHKDIYLLFVFTTDQIDNNEYFCQKSFEAMIFCLKELNKKVHINFLNEKNELEAIKKIINNNIKINKVYTNKDFSPYALQRSRAIKKYAEEVGFIYREFYDYMLFAPHQIKKPDGGFYQIFSWYWKAIQTKSIPEIVVTPKFNALRMPGIIDINKYKSDSFNLPLTKEQVELAITRLPKDYNNLRNEISLIDKGTSQISTAIKYGVVSIRQAHKWAYERFKFFNNSFSRQLLWRDFFYQATYFGQLQNNWKFGENWNKKMDKLSWNNNISHFEKWKNGETGVLLVDAGMKQLNDFGMMHNRVRMICASYLVKNLNIDWRLGEKYFATKLIDYDLIINHCSWQWVAGTGFDAQPYIRIFNPSLQQQKFDREFKYINHFLKRDIKIDEIVDYKESVQKAKKRFSDLN